MLKLVVGMLAFVIASSASAGGWRSMRIDASSEDSFNQSVIAFREKLPRVRLAVFEQSLQDIWVQRAKAAQAEGRDYTAADYLRDVNGLGYEEIVKFTDPTGETAERYFAQAYTSIRSSRPPVSQGVIPGPNPGVESFSGSRTLDAGQSYRAEGRIGGNRD